MSIFLSTVVAVTAVAAVVALVVGLTRSAAAAGANRERADRALRDLRHADDVGERLAAHNERLSREVGRLQQHLKRRYGAEAATQVIPAVVDGHADAGEADTQVIPRFAEPGPVVQWLPNGHHRGQP